MNKTVDLPKVNPRLYDGTCCGKRIYIYIIYVYLYLTSQGCKFNQCKWMRKSDKGLKWVPKQNDCSDNKVKVGLHFGNYLQMELSFLSFVKD